MDYDEMCKHALRLVELHNNEFDFSEVYEDDELEDASEADVATIHSLMYDVEISYKLGD